MKVYAPVICGKPLVNYFPFPTKHIIAYVGKQYLDRFATIKNPRYTFEYKTLEIECPINEISNLTAAPAVKLKHVKLLGDDDLLIRPLYNDFCKYMVIDNAEYTKFGCLQFEKEMETNTDKEVLIPISLYESLVNQACSQE